MLKFWPILQQDIAEYLSPFDHKGLGVAYFNRMMSYNVPAFVRSRHLMVLDVYRRLSSDHSEEKMREIQVLFWCLKMVSKQGQVFESERQF